jgi:hypothetical protein
VNLVSLEELVLVTPQPSATELLEKNTNSARREPNQTAARHESQVRGDRDANDVDWTSVKSVRRAQGGDS